MAATVVSFGEWLPDLPALGNPGLVEALNVLPKDACYSPFQPLETTALGYTALPSRPLGAIWATDVNQTRLYVGDATSLSVRESAGYTNRSSTVYSVDTTVGWSFAQVDDLVIAASIGTRPQRHTLGATTNFTLLSISGEAPLAQYVSKIGQFCILARTTQTTTGQYAEDVRWSAIGDATNWPTPNSATAIATQSGQQFFDDSFGLVRQVVGNDQYGLVFQEKAITRMTYAGPPVVFQFDKISDSVGCPYTNSVVQVGGVTYFLSEGGVFSTDGVALKSLGTNKVNRWLLSQIRNLGPQGIRVYGASDPIRKVIYWGFSDTTSTGRPNSVLAMSYEDGRFTHATQEHEILLEYPSVYAPSGSFSPELGRVTGFNSSFVAGFLAATAGSATITTGDLELNPGGRSYVDGVKPNIESTGTAPAVTVRVGTRNDLATTPAFTATTTPTTATGFADVRSDAKYHRAEVQLVGNFEKAVGLEFKAQPTGER